MTGEQIMDVENKESNGRIYMSVSPEAVLKVSQNIAPMQAPRSRILNSAHYGPNAEIINRVVGRRRIHW